MYPFYRLQEKHPSHSCVLDSAKLSLKTPPYPSFTAPQGEVGAHFTAQDIEAMEPSSPDNSDTLGQSHGEGGRIGPSLASTSLGGYTRPTT